MGRGDGLIEGVRNMLRRTLLGFVLRDLLKTIKYCIEK